MPHLDDEVLARALEVLVQGSRQGDTIVDPFSPLQKEGIPKEAVVQLIQRGCLVGQGRLRFRIVRTTLTPPRPARVAPPPLAEIPDVPDGWFDQVLDSVPPPPAATIDPPPPPLLEPTTEQRPIPATRPPRFLLVVDVENVAKTCRDLHAPFRPEVIREVANQCGEVAFAFALGNLLAVSPRDRELLTLAGFPLLHCARLPDGNGGKDTVDENAQDLIGRFIDHNAVDGVILATDDRNFIPIMVRVRDRGRKLVRIAIRVGTELDRICDVRNLPLHDGETAEGPAAPTRPWTPQLIIDGLQALFSVTTPLERERAIRNMSLQAPLVYRLLRAFLRRRWSTRAPDWLVGFLAFLDDLDAMVLEADRAHVTKEDLRAFLTALNDIGVIEKIMGEKHGRRQVGYRPNWSHPFCAHVIADIRDRGGRSSRWQRPRNAPHGTAGTNGSETNGSDHGSDTPDAPSGEPSEGRR
ncbi:MAG: NYN domain-containing protein [bacterium]|nr:NYN domain-containing protein [bacterium]